MEQIWRSYGNMELVRIRNIQTGKVMAAIADSIEPYYSWKMTRSGYIKPGDSYLKVVWIPNSTVWSLYSCKEWEFVSYRPICSGELDSPEIKKILQDERWER